MKKVALIILDGWGIGDKSKSDAIHNAKTPFMDSLLKKYPWSTLKTSGEDVGLPEGQMGNSEVGHLNIGAGRVVYQDLAKINVEIKTGNFFLNTVLNDAIDHAKKKNVKVHLLGLVSEGGVHSSQKHLHALCDLAKNKNFNDLFLHVITDGRDTDPKSGAAYVENLNQHLKNSAGKIATVIGRYYAMDRDKRWERVKLAYDLFVNGQGTAVNDAVSAISKSYDDGITDEFMLPHIISENGKPVATIRNGDVVICYNFRTDRCREITQALTQQQYPEYGMKPLDLYYVTMTNYDETFKNIHVVYNKDNLKNTLGEVLESAGKTQIRIAETEKYPHVTFFFSGGREQPFEGEKRILIPSPKVATYDLKPEMSAHELTDAIVPELENSTVDFVCLNFANPDMVGHTGVFEAVTKAIETSDSCLEKVVNAGNKGGYSFIIIADHGNADYMINPDGSPNTAHTTNPVPCILIDHDFKTINEGRLADLAPTVLKILGVVKPVEMTGIPLV